jgi:NAD(P)-dependent dehydrogenase (short-subunit alcohol dehydrogenase family)
VAYLASDDADYVTGETLRVDGGFKVGMKLSEKRGYEHQ